MDYYVAPTQWGYETDGGGFSYDVFQGEQPACAVYSQYNVLKDYGYDGTPEDLIEEATRNGWYDPENGTSPENIGKLLESHGVPCNMYVNANQFNLMDELAHGKRVIVTVDSGELWADGKLSKLGEMLEDFLPNGADHALVVSGFDTSDPDNVKVILTDSGSGQNAVSYPLEQFKDAWKDGHCTMIVPRDPPPQELALPELANFDYALGHVANMGDVSYEEWVSDNIPDDQELGDFTLLDVGNGENWEECVQQYYGAGTVDDGMLDDQQFFGTTQL